ncbi:GGDEF domain-containing protein [Thalassotalea sp. M1531]|uniref:diguanylate cyclase n=1 Tax=Thalassotalea algicola TaxID=2716224 RepID=A0A7Y0LAA6_9GAMM|nr:diguanylate cyclase [Thalassotalea algicola]NMP30667.1 GGDEF domain-containing protein [Thalassotalea algicola]
MFFILIFSFGAYADSFEIPEFSDDTLGKHTQLFQEQSRKLSLEEARAQFAQGYFRSWSSNSISLGIDVEPAWMKFRVNNTSRAEQRYRLSIETPWLDYIDTWLVVNGKVVSHIVGGDAIPFEQRPMQYRFYAFEHGFEPGVTEVFIRVETIGPMAMPVRFSAVENAVKNDIANGYQYGVLYGVMMALALYNLVLYVFIRQREYGLYSLYLIGFVVNSLSYTGQLHTLITYDFGPYFQDWLDIFLMITYSVAGLHFARVLLSTKDYAPNLDRFVIRTTVVVPVGMLLGFIFNQLFFSMALAFLLNTCFVILFVAMGIRALYASKPFAVIFILSSVTAAICITISTLAVAGFLVPYNDYTFKAIEVGMAFEAILLAVILARQFRMAKLDKLIAETYARTDTLTQLNNRRGFQDSVKPIWQNICREKRDASIVLLDIDFFKRFNDQYGHDTGDRVLQLVAKCITETCRKGDISARWGGEEFIILLPETSRNQATLQAERIKLAIAALEIRVAQVSLSITASIGVAGTEAGKFNQEFMALNTLELMINQSDRALYVAKQSGKNQVHVQNSN